MTTNRYEVLMLAVPELTQDESKHIENELDKLINSTNGKVVSFERWGKFKLTYPINKNEYGVYFLARFDTTQASALLQEVQSLFRVKLNNLVMRHMVSRLDANAPAEYQRPKSLEEAPASRDMDSFLKENKMEGLLGFEGKERRAPGRSAHAIAAQQAERVSRTDADRS